MKSIKSSFLVVLSVLAVLISGVFLGCQMAQTTGTNSDKTQDQAAENSPGVTSKTSTWKKPESRLNQRVVPRGLDYSKTLEKFAFGSGANQDRPQPIWKTILAQEPDLFVFMGNNIFATEVPQKQISDQYTKLDKIPDYRDFRSKIPFLAIWNDLDYGQASGGSHNPSKEQARKEFLNYWAYVKDSIALNQGPLYHAKTIGGTTVDKKRRRKISKTVPSVHFILLDTRWNRDPLQPFVPVVPPTTAAPVDTTIPGAAPASTSLAPQAPAAAPAAPTASAEANNAEAPVVAEAAKAPVSVETAQPPSPALSSHKYTPSPDPKATLLGETQWEWLEDELKQSVDLIVLVSPIQVVANDHGFEKWGLFPKERDRLFQLIRKTQPKNLIVLSGDRSFGVVSKTEIKGWGTLIDVTSGSLTQASAFSEKDQTYQSEVFSNENFGLVTLDWPNRTAKIELKDLSGKTVSSTDLRLRR